MDAQIQYASQSGTYKGNLSNPKDLIKAFRVILQMEKARLEAIKRELAEINNVSEEIEKENKKENNMST